MPDVTGSGSYWNIELLIEIHSKQRAGRNKVRQLLT